MTINDDDVENAEDDEINANYANDDDDNDAGDDDQAVDDDENAKDNENNDDDDDDSMNTVRHCGLVVSAPAWDGTGCEFDSWQCRIYTPCS